MSGPEPNAADRIVVGVDGSEQSKLALRWAADLARPLGVPIDAVIAWEPLTTYGWPYGATEWNPETDAHEVLNETVKAVFGENRPADLRLVVRRGNAAKVLIDESAGAKMLVVGSRGHGGFVGLLLGSVSAPCAEHSKCPVLVVKESDQAATSSGP